MNRILLPFLLLFASYNISAQIGAGPATDCTSSIPEICPGGSYPASIAGIASAPGASFSCTIGGTNTIEENPSFFYFEAGVTGPLTMQIDPTDPFTGAILFNPQDLDFMCWGPFSNTATMCNGLTATNLITCSYSPGSTEYCFLPNVIAGQFYVILVTNWSSGTPADCNIQFTPDTSLAGGGFAGANATITPCSTDPSFNLISQLNGVPDEWGVWINASNNIVDSIFDPSTDPGGVYRYVIGGTTTCPGDTAWLTINLVSGATMSITSSPTSCSDDSPLTLTGSPSGGTFSGNGVNSNIFTPDISMLGSNIIEYIYQSNGCSDTVTQDLVVYESPIVLPADVLTTNPLCFGYNDGSAFLIASSGQPAYIFNWYGEDPLALTAGIFNYTVTDANQCSFSSSVSLYDPLNTTSIINEYNSSCFGANDGAASITMLGGTTPPGTISLLPYCASNPSPDFDAQAATYIQHVELSGDNSSQIDNNTVAINDFYEGQRIYISKIKDNKDLSIYEDKFKKSWVYEELYAARNVKPSFSWGLILGIIFTGIDQILFRGKLPLTLNHKHADHETLKPANQMPKIEYPKPDGVITFDKTSSVYLTGTNHADNQPVHLKLKDPHLPINYTLEKFDEPAQRYCPAGVYEIQVENNVNKFVINSQNCIHCKTCDIKEPSQNIEWVTPEGGGGPKYGNT